MPIIFEFRVTKWPPNDLKWPILTSQQNFLAKSPFGACHMSFHRYFVMSVLVTWGHLEVIWWFETQIWCVQSTQSTKKPTKRHIACPKVRFGEKFCFEVTVGHLEVIWRSFGDSKLKSYACNRLSVPKNLEKDIWHAPKWDLAKSFVLRSVLVTWGHLGVIWWLETHIW